MQKVLDDLLSKFGKEGMPDFIKPKYKASWDSYIDSYVPIVTPRERVLSVLGFLHLMRQASNEKFPVNPYKAYEALVSEEFSLQASTLAHNLRKMRVFDLFRIVKLNFDTTDVRPKAKCTIALRFSVEPKRKESLNSALSKAEGLLYRGSLPFQLQERWAKAKTNSIAKPKSILLKSTELLKTPSIVSMLPLFVSEVCSLHVGRAKDDKLVFVFIMKYPFESIRWMNARNHNKTVRKLWINALKSIKG